MFTDHMVLQGSGLYFNVMKYNSIDLGKSQYRDAVLPI